MAAASRPCPTTASFLPSLLAALSAVPRKTDCRVAVVAAVVLRQIQQLSTLHVQVSAAGTTAASHHWGAA